MPCKHYPKPQARHVPALSWLLDVAVRLATEALRTATAGGGGGGGGDARPSWRGWRSITSGAIDCARQLAAALTNYQATSAAGAAIQAGVTPEQVQGKLQVGGRELTKHKAYGAYAPGTAATLLETDTWSCS